MRVRSFDKHDVRSPSVLLVLPLFRASLHNVPVFLGAMHQLQTLLLGSNHSEQQVLLCLAQQIAAVCCRADHFRDTTAQQSSSLLRRKKIGWAMRTCCSNPNVRPEARHNEKFVTFGSRVGCVKDKHDACVSFQGYNRTCSHNDIHVPAVVSHQVHVL